MPNLNKCYLMGGLTRDPESKQTQKGTTIANFTLAINNTYTNAAGDKKEDVTYVDCDCFGKLAEIITEYCRKGHTILVIGRLRLDSWEAQDGSKRSKMKVVAEEMQFISKPKGEEEERPRQQSRPPQRTQQLRKPAPRDPDLDSVDDDSEPY